MNSNNILTCKIKLMVDDEQQEIRRITLEPSFASDIGLFKDKMRAVFPQLARNPFDITWLDIDNDTITIANDEDLIGAMMAMEGLKNFNVHLSTKSDEEDAEEMMNEGIGHGVPRVTCDVCNNHITRYRYKCMQCHDYDLCLNCEQAGNHSHHIMMRLANLELPRFLPKIMGHMSRSARKAAHHAAKEAHRCAKATARAATSAASYASSGYRHQREGNPGAASASAAGPAGCPAMDTGFLYDLAASFLGPFAHAATGTTSATTNAGATTQNSQQQQQTTQNVPPTSNAEQQTPITPDVFGDVLKNIISAINSGAQAASAASSGTSTPMKSASSKDDVQIVDPVPTPTPKTTFIPMEVESNELYPNLSKAQTTTTPVNTGNNNQNAAPEAGWTIINNSGGPKEPTSGVATQASAPVAPPATNTEDAKYAEALAQLQRMGFADNGDLKTLLQRYDGNIGFVVNHLFDRNASS